LTTAVDVRPLRREDVEMLAELHNDAFSDYVVPAALDPTALSFYLDETGVDPALSRIAFVDGRPASFCLGAVRGAAASIRGEGTAVEFRRQGLGARVLEEVLAELRGVGARHAGLEVLSSNAAAIALYSRFGFGIRRSLYGWSFRMPPRRRGAHTPAVPIETEDALVRLAGWGWTDAPWQLQPETLVHLPAYALGDAAVAVGKLRGRRFWLYALGVDPRRRRRGLGTALLRALPGTRVGVPALLPGDWPGVSEFLESAGGVRERHMQYEMTAPML
jgi:ribosomal protein S18 acetylase RimI-like enzyme